MCTCCSIAIAKRLTSLREYVHNLTESPPRYAISRLVLNISGTQQPLGRYFHSDVFYDVPQNAVFFF